MKRKLNILTYLYTLFLVLLFLSGQFSGIIGDLIYFLSFALPFVIGVILSRGQEGDISFEIDKENLKFTLPLIMPTVVVTIILAFITNLVIFTITGRTNYVYIGDSFVLAIITHAVLPAIFEELLFRYLPARILSGHSEKLVVLYSAFFFSLVHMDLFSIPYAFFGGVIFMMVDLATGSIIPSILIHFINNALSVGATFYSDNPAFLPTMYTIVAIVTLISIVFIIKNRKKYKYSAQIAFLSEKRVSITLDMLIFAAIILMLAIADLLF